MSAVLEDYLVRLGFKVDESSLRKFEDGLAKAAKMAIALEAAVIAAATAVTAATIKMSGAFEDMHYASQRTGASIQNLKALQYAFTQVGRSSAVASAAVESFSRNIRTNPGIAGFVKSLGVQLNDQSGKARDTVDVMMNAIDAIKKKHPYYVGAQYAALLGIDEGAFNTFTKYRTELGKFQEEYAKAAKSVGLNTEEAGRKSAELDRSLRSLWLTVTVAAEKILTDFTPAIKALVDRIREWIAANPDKIEQFIVAIGEASKSVAKWMMAPDGFVAALGKVERGITAIVDAGSKLIAFFRLLNMEKPGVGVAATWARGEGGGGSSAGSSGIGGMVGRARRWIGRTLGIGGASAAEGASHPAGTSARGAGGGGASRGGAHYSGDNASALKAAAKDLGTSPEDLATVIGYETMGTFSPSIRGGAGNKYIGLIQFGPSEQKQFGADQGQTFPEQMGAVVRYLKKRGFKPGMSLLDLYSTINAGSPGHPDRHDMNGSVREHAARMAVNQRGNVAKFLAGGGSSSASDNMVFGDSIAAGLIGASGGKLAGKGVERITSEQILANIKAYPSDQLKGKFVYLASGSNSPNQLDAIRQSVSYLRGAGVRGVTLLGAGDAPQIAGLDSNLRGLAKDLGVGYNGLGALAGDHVHPKDYKALGQSLAKVPDLSPQSLAGSDTDNSRVVNQSTKVDIHVQGGADATATANAIANHQGKVSNTMMRDAHSAIR